MAGGSTVPVPEATEDPAPCLLLEIFFLFHETFIVKHKWKEREPDAADTIIAV